MKLSFLKCAVFALFLTGCESAQVQDVKSVVSDVVKEEIKTQLGAVNSSSKPAPDPKETLTLVRELAKDYVSLEGQKVLDAKLKEVEGWAVSKTELGSKEKETWSWLIGLVGTMVAGYLGKQVVSAKNDGHRDARIMKLEALLGKDLDGDGEVGDSAPAPAPPTT